MANAFFGHANMVPQRQSTPLQHQPSNTIGDNATNVEADWSERRWAA